jgi:hypothetical protein
MTGDCSLAKLTHKTIALFWHNPKYFNLAWYYIEKCSSDQVWWHTSAIPVTQR